MRLRIARESSAAFAFCFKLLTVLRSYTQLKAELEEFEESSRTLEAEQEAEIERVQRKFNTQNLTRAADSAAEGGAGAGGDGRP